MKKTIIISLVALLFTTTLFAQQTKEQNTPEKRVPTVEEIAKRKADHMREQYLLGKDQYDKVYKLCLKQAKKDEARHKEIMSEREQMAKDMKGILNDAQWERYEKNQKRPAMHRQNFRHNQRGFMMHPDNRMAPWQMHKMGNFAKGNQPRMMKGNQPFGHPELKDGKPMMQPRRMMKAEPKNEAEKSAKETNENSKE